MILMAILWSFGIINAQSLNIGTLTAVKSENGRLLVAGTDGIASLNADKTVNWQTSLPFVTIRLLHADKDGIAWSGYTIEGTEKNVLSTFSSLWDKLVVSQDNVGMLDASGKEVWTRKLQAQARISEPAVSNDLFAVNSPDTLYIYKKSSGQLVAASYNSRTIAIKGMKSQITPNRPLITNDAIYSTGAFLLMKTDLQGKRLKEEKMYGMQKDLSIMSVSPILRDNNLIFGNCAIGAKNTKLGCSRIYAADPDLKEKWNEFVDTKTFTGITEMAENADYVFVATSWNVYAFTPSGKSKWDFSDLGKPAYRGTSCSGNICIKTVDGTFLLADDKAVYVSSYHKDRKKKTESENVTVIDSKTGKLVKSTEVTGKIWDMALLDSKVAVLTTDGLQLIDK